MDNKAHFVCTGGCKGVTDKEGARCQAEDCSKYNQPLTPCDCTDSEHRQAYAKDSS